MDEMVDNLFLDFSNSLLQLDFFRTTDENENETIHRNKTGKNPLLNERVLENLFSKLDIEELKNARLVCFSWYNIGGKELSKISWKSLKPVSFHYAEEIKRFIQIFENKNVKFIPSSFHLTGRSFNFSSIHERSKYIIFSHEFFSQFSEKIKKLSLDCIKANYFLEFEYVLNVLAPNLENLEMIFDKDYQLQIPKNFVFINGNIFSELRSLSIRNAQNINMELWGSLHQFLQQIVKNAPKLKSLNLPHKIITNSLDFHSERIEFSVLTEVGLSGEGYLKNDVFDKLQNSSSKGKLQLNKFNVNCVRESNLECLNRFLITQAKSLENLTIQFKDGYSLFTKILNFFGLRLMEFQNFPALQNLKSLNIKFNFDPPLYARPICYSGSFPNLKEFYLTFEKEPVLFLNCIYLAPNEPNIENFKRYFFNESQCQHEKLERISLDLNLIDENILTQMCNLFPKVKDFKIFGKVDDEKIKIFNELWKCWNENLEKLTIYFEHFEYNFDLEKLLTSETAIENKKEENKTENTDLIHNEVESNASILSNSESKEQIIEEIQSLKNFKQLRELHIDFDEYNLFDYPIKKITDNCFNNTFFKMTKLKKIIINKSLLSISKLSKLNLKKKGINLKKI